jgi:outer membrane receptor protein involved in Fe transport
MRLGIGLALSAWAASSGADETQGQDFGFLTLRSATGFAQPPSESPPALDAEDPASGDGLDDLLDLDVDALSRADVLVPTMTDPVVAAVSKAPEKASEAAGIVDVITAEEIEMFGAKNLFEVLERGTSVFMTGSFLFRNNVVSIRGDLLKHQDNHILVLINGRPFRDTSQGGVNASIYTAFPVHMIDRVEVLRGPGSVLYGTNAFSGVVNIITKTPDKPLLHAGALAGTDAWQSYGLSAGGGDEVSGAYAGSTYSRQDGWTFTATSEDPFGPPVATTDTALWGEDNAGLFAMYRNGDFTANVFFAETSSEILGPLPTWPSGQLDLSRLFVDFGYALEFDPWQSLDLNFTYNYLKSEFPGAFSTPAMPVVSDTTANSFLLEGTYRAELSPNMNFMLGGVIDFHTGYGYTATDLQVPHANEIWYGAYMQLDYRATDNLKLVGGMQANMPGDIKSGIVPRAGVIYSFDDHWTTKFLYGQAFRSPYQIERTITVPGVLIGNPDLAPETIQTFDAQLAYRTDEFRLAATYFHSEIFDIVTRVGFPQTYVNEGSMTLQGVELENEWQLTDRLRWIGSLTYQDNVRDGEHNTTGVPHWMAKMGLAYYNCNGLTVGLFDTFYGDQTVPAGAAVVNPAPDAYHLVSLNTTLDLDQYFHWHTGTSTRLQFLIQNLLDEDIHHVEFERELINSLPAGAGRTFYGGVAVSY